MRKSIKMITAVIVAALAAISLVFLVACQDTPAPATEYYTVTVLYPDGTAVNGQTDGTAGSNNTQVSVQFCDATNNAYCAALQYLGADGTLQVDKSMIDEAVHNATSIAVHLNGLPDGYTYSDTYTVSPTSTSVTINLTAVAPVVNYEVSVTFPTVEGVSFANAKVEFGAESQTESVDIVDGKAVVDTATISSKLSGTSYTVTVTGLPDGYKVKSNATVSATALTATLEVVAIQYYEVKVTLPTVSGVDFATASVQFSDGEHTWSELIGNNGGVKVDADVVNAEVTGTTKTVTVIGLPVGYKVVAPATLVDSAATLEVKAIAYYQIGVSLPTVSGVSFANAQVSFSNGTDHKEYDITNGRVTVDSDEVNAAVPGTITVTVVGLPTDYMVSATATVSATSLTASLSVVAVPYYEVQIMEGGEPFEETGVTVVFTNPEEGNKTHQVLASAGKVRVKVSDVYADCQSNTVNVTVTGTAAHNLKQSSTVVTLNATSLSANIELVPIVNYTISVQYERSGALVNTAGLQVKFSNPEVGTETYTANVTNGRAIVDIDVIAAAITSTEVKVELVSAPAGYEIAEDSTNVTVSATSATSRIGSIKLTATGFYTVTVYQEQGVLLRPVIAAVITPYKIKFTNPTNTEESYEIELGDPDDYYSDGTVKVDVKNVNAVISSDTINVTVLGDLPFGYELPSTVYTVSDAEREVTITLALKPTDATSEPLVDGNSYTFTSDKVGLFRCVVVPSENGINPAILPTEEDCTNYIAWNDCDVLYEYDSDNNFFEFQYLVANAEYTVWVGNVDPREGSTILRFYFLHEIQPDAPEPEVQRTSITIDNTSATNAETTEAAELFTTTATTAGNYELIVSVARAYTTNLGNIRVALGDSVITLDFNSDMNNPQLTSFAYRAVLSLAQGANNFELSFFTRMDEEITTAGFPYSVAINTLEATSLIIGENTGIAGDTMYVFSGVGNYTITVSNSINTDADGISDLYLSQAQYDAVNSVASSLGSPTYSFTLLEGQAITFILYVSGGDTTLTIAAASAVPELIIDSETPLQLSIGPDGYALATITASSASASFNITATISDPAVYAGVYRFGIIGFQDGNQIMSIRPSAVDTSSDDIPADGIYEGVIAFTAVTGVVELRIYAFTEDNTTVSDVSFTISISTPVVDAE